MTDAELIQRFVDCFARLDDSTFSHGDPPPPEFNDGMNPDDWNDIHWRPVAVSTSPESLTAIRRAGVLPTLYEQLVTSYRRPAIDTDIVRLLLNMPSGQQPFANCMFADPVLNNTLVPNSFVLFGLAPNECFDPICFDLNRSANADCPVVRLNHEYVLCNDTLGEVETDFDTFRELMLAVLAIENQL